MSIAAVCTNCGKRYNVDARAAGKKVKCRQCGQIFAAPAPQAEAGAPAEVDLDALMALGRQESPQSGYGGSEPPFTSSGTSSGGDYEDPPLAGKKQRRVPVAESAMLGSGRFGPDRPRRRRGGDSFVGLWMLWVLVPVAGMVVAGHYSPTFGKTGGIILLLCGALLSVAANILAIATIVRESVASLLLVIFVPFYALYYLVTRWSEMRGPFFLGCFASLLLIGGVFMQASAAADEQRRARTEVAAAGGGNPSSGGAGSSWATLDPNPSANPNPGPSPETTKQPDWSSTPPAAPVATKRAIPTRFTPDGELIPPPPEAEGPDDLGAAFDDGEPQGATLPVLTKALEEPLAGTYQALWAPDRPSPWVFAARGEGRKMTIERLSTKDWKPNGELSLIGDAGEFAFSPEGGHVVRKVRFPREALEVWSFDQGKMLHRMDLASSSTSVELVGFTSETEFVVQGGGRGSALLVFCSVKTGKQARQIKVPSYRAGAVGISPDGKLIALATKEQGPAQVIVYNTTGGVRKRLPIRGTEKQSAFSFDPEAIAFSADGKYLAAEIKQQGRSAVYCWQVADGKPIGANIYPGSDTPARAIGSRGGPRLQWVPGTDCLLVNGRSILDPVSGRFLGRTSEGDVEWHRIVGQDKLLLDQRVESEQRIELVQIDVSKLKAAAASARTAGPMLFEPPPLETASWPIKINPAKEVHAKSGGPIDPAPRPAKPLTAGPIPLAPPFNQIRDVLLARNGFAVVHGGATAGPSAGETGAGPTGRASGRSSSAGDWDVGEVAGAFLQRYDLTTGKQAGTVNVPTSSRALAVGPDGDLALLGTKNDGGTKKRPAPSDAAAAPDRLDVWSIAAGKHLTGWVPYAAAEVSQRGVRWATLADKDGVLTLSAGNVLIRWSINGRRALWARDGVREAPTLSAGGKFVAVRQGEALLCLDVKSGAALGQLEAPTAGNYEILHADFSPDGTSLAAATPGGLLAWDVAAGTVDKLWTDPLTNALEHRGGRYLLLGDRLFDARKRDFVFTYPTAGGRHLYDAPDGRHWYLARSPVDGAPHLCAAELPSSAHLKAITQQSGAPPMIRPGVHVGLQVNAGDAAGKLTEALQTRMNTRGFEGAGEQVATLRVSAQLVTTDELVHALPTRGSRRGGGSSDSVQTVQIGSYECFYEMVGAKGNILYGTQTEVIRAPAGIGQRARLDAALLEWARRIYIPTYMSADGRVAMKPEAKLGVDAK